jgi:ribosome-associated translation inhibitor RaiA
MQTPVQIEFRGMDASDHVRGSITAHIAQLEQRFGRVTACHVLFKAPDGHHRTGAPYEVHIRLALPNGREVNVSRTAKADERHSDLSFAINDAFHRARRRLQDHARRMQGRTKTHDDAARETV